MNFGSKKSRNFVVFGETTITPGTKKLRGQGAITLLPIYRDFPDSTVFGEILNRVN